MGNLWYNVIGWRVVPPSNILVFKEITRWIGKKSPSGNEGGGEIVVTVWARKLNRLPI